MCAHGFQSALNQGVAQCVKAAFHRAGRDSCIPVVTFQRLSVDKASSNGCGSRRAARSTSKKCRPGCGQRPEYIRGETEKRRSVGNILFIAPFKFKIGKRIFHGRIKVKPFQSSEDFSCYSRHTLQRQIFQNRTNCGRDFLLHTFSRPFNFFQPVIEAS